MRRSEFGETPLYCRLDEKSGEVVYSTSVRELLEKGAPRKLSREGLWSYLAYGCVYAPWTLIEGVYMVPPGCEARLESDGKFSFPRYWTPSFKTKAWSREEAQAAVDAELKRAIQEQTGGNPAAFLSGGIDSSAIVALWRQQYEGEIRTYCVTHEDERTDERQWARMVAERNHTKHTELMLEDRMIRQWLDEAVASYDQPSLDGLNFWFATKLAGMAGERVMLSGEGGDELFVGYWQFLKHRLAYKYAPAVRYCPRWVGGVLDRICPSEKVRKLAMLCGSRMEPYYIPRRIMSDWQIARVLSEEAKGPVDRLERLELASQEELPGDLINRISWLEMQTVVADMWMRDGYQTSQANGVEIRTPLCDRGVAELLYTIPGEYKCDPNISKPMLVKAAGEGIPMACVTRKKQGFALPFDRYFSGEVKDRIDEFLSGNNTKLFKPAVVREMGRQYRTGKLYWSRIWTLFMVENWCRQNKVEL